MKGKIELNKNKVVQKLGPGIIIKELNKKLADPDNEDERKYLEKMLKKQKKKLAK